MQITRHVSRAAARVYVTRLANEKEVFAECFVCPEMDVDRAAGRAGGGVNRLPGRKRSERRRLCRARATFKRADCGSRNRRTEGIGAILIYIFRECVSKPVQGGTRGRIFLRAGDRAEEGAGRRGMRARRETRGKKGSDKNSP